jgi:hypothetical protein
MDIDVVVESKETVGALFDQLELCKHLGIVVNIPVIATKTLRAELRIPPIGL